MNALCLHATMARGPYCLLCAWASWSVCVQARPVANRRRMCFKAVASACCRWLDAVCLTDRQCGYVSGTHLQNAMLSLPCSSNAYCSSHTWKAALLQQQLMHFFACFLFLASLHVLQTVLLNHAHELRYANSAHKVCYAV